MLFCSVTVINKFYVFFTFFRFVLLVFFLTSAETPLDGFLLVWVRVIAPRMVEYLGLSPKLRPVTAFFAPWVFVIVFTLLFLGFLPYSVEVIID